MTHMSIVEPGKFWIIWRQTFFCGTFEAVEVNKNNHHKTPLKKTSIKVQTSFTTIYQGFPTWIQTGRHSDKNSGNGNRLPRRLVCLVILRDSSKRLGRCIGCIGYPKAYFPHPTTTLKRIGVNFFLARPTLLFPVFSINFDRFKFWEFIILGRYLHHASWKPCTMSILSQQLHPVSTKGQLLTGTRTEFREEC